jgi:hypothetical protein
MHVCMRRVPAASQIVNESLLYLMWLVQCSAVQCSALPAVPSPSEALL